MSMQKENTEIFNNNRIDEGYCLVIAEKPSVAQSIAKVIGASIRRDGYLESPSESADPNPSDSQNPQTRRYLVSWCVGHLVELAMPEQYNEAFAKWRYEDLPIFPQNTDSGWQYQISEKTKKQFNVLKNLMNRSDVTSICLATDAGREGELIGRLVCHQCGCTKPMTRLWISSMEDQAIKEGFRNLKPSSEYDSLYKAALCRERADWLVGINASRLFSCLYRQKLNVGRVMTPTLSMIVHRDMEILTFRSKPFYTVELEFPEFTAVSRKMEDVITAGKLLKICQNTEKAKIKKVQRKEKKEHAPALYDLTSLQRDANRILGFTAQQTLDYAQSLYEKKLITYPRTDSRYLTEDMSSSLPEWIHGIAEKFSVNDFHPSEEGYRQVINSRKVTDHHAIIPTRTFQNADLEALPAGELQICRLIAGRFLTAVSSPHFYTETVCFLTCDYALFTAKGKENLQDGWKAIEKQFRPAENQENSENQKRESAGLPSFTEGEEVIIRKAEIKEGSTTPPKKFTEDSLLSAMESAGSSDFPEQAERKGLGTPATRAGIIEKLVRTGLVKREGEKKTRYLTATEKGLALITVMPEQIQSPSMTADWEMKLLRIEQNQFSAEEFINEITAMVTGLIQNYIAVEDADAKMNQERVLGTCPHCGAAVVEYQKDWACINRICKFILWKDNAYFNSLGKKLNRSMAMDLVQFRKLKLNNCTSKKSGKSFDATVLLNTDDSGKAVFSLEFDQKAESKNSDTNDASTGIQNENLKKENADE